MIQAPLGLGSCGIVVSKRSYIPRTKYHISPKAKDHLAPLNKVRAPHLPQVR